jgi:hypothetical protein
MPFVLLGDFACVGSHSNSSCGAGRKLQFKREEVSARRKEKGFVKIWGKNMETYQLNQPHQSKQGEIPNFILNLNCYD